MGRRFFCAVVVTLSLLVSHIEAGKPAPRPAAPHVAAPHVNPTPNPATSHFNNAPHNVQQPHNAGHPATPGFIPNGPQRVNPALKTQMLKDAPRVQQGLAHVHHWHHWHHWHNWHGWAWGIYPYLPLNYGNMVVGVPSGNTLSVTNASGIARRVRLAGVGAPVAGQAMFSESRDNLDALANGRHVRVFDVGTDFDGTIVAQVFLDSGVYLNERQLRDGMAWNSVEDGYDQSLASAEETAQTGGAGMWGADYSAAF
jgi:endonuclease YncB( thermonuclease family)